MLKTNPITSWIRVPEKNELTMGKTGMNKPLSTFDSCLSHGHCLHTRRRPFWITTIIHKNLMRPIDRWNYNNGAKVSEYLDVHISHNLICLRRRHRVLRWRNLLRAHQAQMLVYVSPHLFHKLSLWCPLDQPSPRGCHILPVARAIFPEPKSNSIPSLLIIFQLSQHGSQTFMGVKVTWGSCSTYMTVAHIPWFQYSTSLVEPKYDI